MEQRNKILVVEDNAGDVARITAVLQSHRYELSFASEGQTAIDSFLRQPPDLMILDILLPDMDGYEVCRRVRRQQQYVNIPILFYSTVQALDERLMGWEMGASDFLHKGADDRELVVRVKNLLKSKRTLDEMVKLSFTDGLTEIYNRRYFQCRLGDEFTRSRRFDNKFCFAIVDIDNFKQINDDCGHLTGDRVLKRVAGMLRNNSRESDVVCRYGGDEFGWLMPETDLQGAYIGAERVRRFVERACAEQSEFQGTVTVSCGISVYGERTAIPEDMVTQADQALYQAKNAGRNQTRTSLS